MLAPTIDVIRGADIPLALSTSHVDSTYVNLSLPDSEPRWFDVRYPGGVRIKGDREFTDGVDLPGMAVDAANRHVLLVPPGRSRFSAASSGSAGDESLILRPLQMLTDGIQLNVSAGEWSPYVVRLDPEMDRDTVWNTVVPAKVMRPIPGGTLRMRVLVDAYATGGKLFQNRQTDPTAKPSGKSIDYPAAPPSFTSISYRVQILNEDAQSNTSLGLIETASSSTNEFDVIPIQNDGTVEVALSYIRDQSSTAPRQPVYVPIALALGKIVSVDNLVARLKRNPDLWNDPDQIDRAVKQLPEPYAGREKPETIETSLTLRQRRAELLPNDPEAQNSLAWGYIVAGRGKEALVSARSAAERTRRSDPNILDTLAHAEYAQGHWKEAVDAWDTLLKLDSDYYKPVKDPYCANDQRLIAAARRNAGAAGSLR
jgi:hypothetical protein